MRTGTDYTAAFVIWREPLHCIFHFFSFSHPCAADEQNIYMSLYLAEFFLPWIYEYLNKYSFYDCWSTKIIKEFTDSIYLSCWSLKHLPCICAFAHVSDQSTTQFERFTLLIIFQSVFLTIIAIVLFAVFHFFPFNALNDLPFHFILFFNKKNENLWITHAVI